MSIGDLNSKERGSAARSNGGKTRLDLIPLSSLKPCADVFEFGAKKYAPNNWMKGMDWSHPYASLLRHMDAWYRGEDNDPESGLSHIGHAMCNLVMLAHYLEFYREGDDRPAEFFKQGGLDGESKEIHLGFFDCTEEALKAADLAVAARGDSDEDNPLRFSRDIF